jgi:hypothetical protein
MAMQDDSGYDLIGDIHGQAGMLRALLHRLGYRETDGVYRHPQRQVLFLGDFIDRGPRQRETLAICRAMVTAGSARAVLGNHEFNALAWQTEDPDAPGTYLRPHSAKNRKQHGAFLAEVEQAPGLYADILCWFRSLPLYLDLPGLRVIHACWHEHHLQALSPYLTDDNRLTDNGLIAASRRGHPAHAALEVLLKGVEVALPGGASVQDKDGHVRTKVRVRWWDTDATDYRTAALVDASQRAGLPSSALPPATLIGYSDEKPLFLGHYWMQGRPAPLTPKLACLDYSAANGGALCGYRWHGESLLRAEQFCCVPAR